jgi:hypothetical protein
MSNTENDFREYFVNVSPLKFLLGVLFPSPRHRCGQMKFRYKNLSLSLSDVAPCVVKATIGLKTVHPKVVHVTCVVTPCVE